MKICIFGGVFDPLHLGHEKVIETLLLRFDKVVIMPAKQSPGKKTAIASDIDRLKMLSLCRFFKNSRLIIDEYELKSDKMPSFTINSIKYIKNKFKGDDIYLAIGLDQFNNLPNWYNFKELLGMVKLICFNRSASEHVTLPIEYEIIKDFNYDISSSEIKSLIQSDPIKIKEMVNKNIFNYIINEKLYQC